LIRFLRAMEMLIIEILNIFLWLKFSSSLNLKRIEGFQSFPSRLSDLVETGGVKLKMGSDEPRTLNDKRYFHVRISVLIE